MDVSGDTGMSFRRSPGFDASRSYLMKDYDEAPRSARKSPLKTRAASASHIISTNAQHQRELSDLQKRYRSLDRQFTAANDKLQEYTAEVKRLRFANERLERDVIMARRSLEHLSNEKSALETASRHDRDYIKRLEAKIALGIKEMGFAEKTAHMENRLARYKEENKNQAELIDLQERQLLDYQHEIRTLSNALQTRAEDLGLQSADIKNNLLYELASARDDRLRLAMEIAEKGSEIKELKDILSSTKHELEKAESERRAALDDASEARQHTTELQQQMNDAREKLREFQHKNDLLGANAQDDKAQITSLKQRVTELERRGIEREHLLVATETVHRKARTELEEAQQRIADLTRIRGDHDSVLQREREKNEKLHRIIEEKDMEILRLKQESEAVHTVATQLQADVDTAYSEKDRVRAMAEQYKGKLQEMQRAMGELSGSRSTAEQQLRKQLEATKNDHESLHEQTRSLAASLDEAVERIAAAEVAKDTAEKECEDMRHELRNTQQQLETMAQAKVVLQKTMLEQINSVRAQLVATQEQLRQLEQENNVLAARNEQLLILVEAERRASSVTKSPTPSARRTVSTPGRSPPLGHAPVTHTPLTMHSPPHSPLQSQSFEGLRYSSEHSPSVASRKTVQIQENRVPTLVDLANEESELYQQ